MGSRTYIDASQASSLNSSDIIVVQQGVTTSSSEADKLSAMKRTTLEAISDLFKADFVEKETGKTLSENDFTDEYKEELDNLSSNYATQDALTAEAQRASGIEDELYERIDDIESYIPTGTSSSNQLVNSSALASEAERASEVEASLYALIYGDISMSSTAATVAGTYADEASGYAASALTSKNSASGYAASALTSKNSASGYASSAKDSKDSAAAYESSALTSKNSASGYAASALTSKNSAAEYAASALAAKDNAISYASSAEDSKNNAVAYAASAETAKDGALESSRAASNAVSSGAIASAIATCNSKASEAASAASSISSSIETKADKTTVEAIASKIPSAATASNQLADKAFVSSGLTAINNKIPSAATASNQLADKAFVSASYAAKATETSLSSHVGASSIHVTSEEKSSWNGKQASSAKLSALSSMTDPAETSFVTIGANGTFGKTAITSYATSTALDTEVSRASTAETNLNTVISTVNSNLQTLSGTALKTTSTTFTNSSLSSFTASSMVLTCKSITSSGDINSTGGKVYSAVWNDIADGISIPEDDVIEPGFCYSMSEDGHYHKSERHDISFIGIESDTYGICMGRKDGDNKLNVAIAGFVLAYVDKEYECGTPLVTGEDGYLTEGRDAVCINPALFVASYWKPEKSSRWGDEGKEVDVNGRHWVKIR